MPSIQPANSSSPQRSTSTPKETFLPSTEAPPPLLTPGFPREQPSEFSLTTWWPGQLHRTTKVLETLC
ncbi:unnamed protein product [Coffea canephora]|uniref:Uncharacterized protein n=1 Tax=Coffea canephora TaxID=49390 RepID=A0A068V4W5_COFCA|nr:unnamed protein product [Coffea canephora]